MNQAAAFIVLAILAVLCTIAVVGVLRQPHIEPVPPEAPAEAAASTPDAGSLDSMLDAIRVEHLLKHGR